MHTLVNLYPVLQSCPFLEGLLKGHTYYHLMDNLEAFTRMWAVSGVLCSVGRDGGKERKGNRMRGE